MCEWTQGSGYNQMWTEEFIACVRLSLLDASLLASLHIISKYLGIIGLFVW